MSKKLCLLNIGDELLLGIRVNGHLAYLGEELARRGLNIESAAIVRDETPAIKHAFTDAWQRHDIIITTGGLGPTGDDMTRESIAEAMGTELEFDPWAQEAIQKRFERTGRKIGPRDLKQCYKPKGAELLPNRLGTAPGLFYKDPKTGKLFFMLPGPTNELKYMFKHEVLPKLRMEGALGTDEAYIQLRTSGIPEGMIEGVIEPVTSKHAGLGLAYCVHQGIVDIRISPGTLGCTWAELQAISREIATELGENFMCFGNCSVGRIVFDQLRSMEKTLAIAESCTGGQLGDAFTDIPGASKVFMGGIICYTNDTKVEMLDVPDDLLQQHGAVSAEVAVAMATGVAERMGADYGLSITGFAGPEGGTQENPVGTVYIGYHSPVGVWSHKVVFPGDRMYVKGRAVNAALDLMRRKLNKYKLAEYLCELH